MSTQKDLKIVLCASQSPWSWPALHQVHPHCSMCSSVEQSHAKVMKQGGTCVQAHTLQSSEANVSMNINFQQM